MTKNIFYSIQESEEDQLKNSREIFAKYGLNPNGYPKLKSALENYEERKKATEIRFGGVHDRECPACNRKYFGGIEICGDCLDVYKNEELFWKQGKKLEN